MDELTEKEKQYITSAIDAYIRQNGLNVASLGLICAMKIQGKPTETEPGEPPPEGDDPD